MIPTPPVESQFLVRFSAKNALLAENRRWKMTMEIPRQTFRKRCTQVGRSRSQEQFRYAVNKLLWFVIFTSVRADAYNNWLDKK